MSRTQNLIIIKWSSLGPFKMRTNSQDIEWSKTGQMLKGLTFGLLKFLTMFNELNDLQKTRSGLVTRRWTPSKFQNSFWKVKQHLDDSNKLDEKILVFKRVWFLDVWYSDPYSMRWKQKLWGGWMTGWIKSCFKRCYGQPKKLLSQVHEQKTKWFC